MEESLWMSIKNVGYVSAEKRSFRGVSNKRLKRLKDTIIRKSAELWEPELDFLP